MSGSVSVVRFTDFGISRGGAYPAMNRWAIFIRSLRELFASNHGRTFRIVSNGSSRLDTSNQFHYDIAALLSLISQEKESWQLQRLRKNSIRLRLPSSNSIVRLTISSWNNRCGTFCAAPSAN